MDKFQEEQMKQQADIAGERTAKGFQSAMDTSQELLKATADQAAQKYGEAKARLQEGVAQARQRFAETQSVLTDQATHAAEMTKSYVVANPWKSVAIVGSVGVLLGMLLSRRSDIHYE